MYILSCLYFTSFKPFLHVVTKLNMLNYWLPNRLSSLKTECLPLVFKTEVNIIFIFIFFPWKFNFSSLQWLYVHWVPLEIAKFKKIDYYNSQDKFSHVTIKNQNRTETNPYFFTASLFFLNKHFVLYLLPSQRSLAGYLLLLVFLFCFPWRKNSQLPCIFLFMADLFCQN